MFKKHEFVFSDRKPRLLITGAVHGNETCGTKALLKLVENIKQKAIVIDDGALTLIPAVNVAAYAKGTRYIDTDLNRVMDRKYDGDSYEEELAVHLMDEIDRCDYLLDLHSFSGDGPAFLFEDYNDDSTIKWAECLGIEHILKGWPELAAKHYDVSDTASYAHAQGKTVLTAECGQHEDSRAVALAYNIIVRSLTALGLCSGEIKKTQKKYITISDVVMKDNDGEMLKSWKNFDHVNKGQHLAKSESQGIIAAHYDGYIIMPHDDAKIGEEWFYTGTAA